MTVGIEELAGWDLPDQGRQRLFHQITAEPSARCDGGRGHRARKGQDNPEDT